MIQLLADPQLTNPEISVSFPLGLSFTANSDLPATYLVSWGDGESDRAILVGGRTTRLSHAYARAGAYPITVQIFAPDDASVSKLRVKVNAPRDREKPLHRWSGPIMGLGSVDAYNTVVERDFAPVSYQLQVESAVGSKAITLPTGVYLLPGDRVTLVADGRLSSGGSIRGVTETAAGVVVELDFFLTDTYERGADVQVVSGRESYGPSGRVRDRPTRFVGGRDNDLIHDSVGIILSTSPGERVMRPSFGFRGRELAFEPNTATLAALSQSYAVEALNSEPRVRLVNVETASEDHSLVVRGSLVFPDGKLSAFSQDLLRKE